MILDPPIARHTPAAMALDFLGRNIARVFHHGNGSRYSEEQFQASLLLLELIPLELATPVAGVNDRGEVFFCWEHHERPMTLALVAEPDAIRFSAEFGRLYRQGREKFNGLVLPVTITELVSSFPRCDA
jgi:hypothetical protein